MGAETFKKAFNRPNRGFLSYDCDGKPETVETAVQTGRTADELEEQADEPFPRYLSTPLLFGWYWVACVSVDSPETTQKQRRDI